MKNQMNKMKEAIARNKEGLVKAGIGLGGTVVGVAGTLVTQLLVEKFGGSEEVEETVEFELEDNTAADEVAVTEEI